MCIFGLGFTALALASSPVDAASSSTEGKPQSGSHSSQKAAKPAQATYPPTQTTAQPAYAPSRPAAAPVAAAPVERSYTFGEMIAESMFGDVYAEPSRWQELGYGNLFSKGWNKPWASPPAGGGGAPRHGWINAEDGVFYRLSIATFVWQHGTGNYSDGYAGYLTSYTPLSARMEIRTDIGLTSNRGPTGTGDAQTNFADFIVTPRILLSETKEQTQSFDIALRTPTGNSYNGQGYAAVSPQYNFWTNYWKGLVVRGGVGFNIPYSGEIANAGARSTFNARLAAGYYFTLHDSAPFGDLAVYVSSNLTQAIDNRGPNSTTTFTMGPGFRDHLGDNWFLLGALDVPVTNPKPYDYQVFGGIMKVY
ncbi:MAG: hypothetical protein NTX45_14200 [Proteobacteria bacterium]|nr:hypothetical protein [Pseudomonadota bacterium]